MTVASTTAGISTTIPTRILARGSALRSVLAPVAFGAIFLGLWQLFVVALDIAPNILPSPSAIGAALLGVLGAALVGLIELALRRYTTSEVRS